MPTKPTELTAAELRSRAEAALPPENPETQSPEAISKMLHELRVHQIELEMQNEELRRARAELEVSRERYVDLYDFAPIGYLTLSETGMILKANYTFATLLGVARGAVVNQPFSRFIFEEDQDKFYLLHKRMLATAAASLGQEIASEWCELRMVKNDIAHFWVEMDVKLLPDEGGAPTLRITLRDVTDRKQVQAALWASEEFRSMAESMPQIVWATRPDGWAIYLNQQWVDYTGLTREESCGDGWSVPVHPDDKERVWIAWRRATQHRETYALECRLRRADGAYLWWLIRGVPQLNESGVVLKWIGTCTDIDGIKRTEERRQELEAQLRQAQKMEAVGCLASGIAHHFNNIMQSVLICSEMLVHSLSKHDKAHELAAEILKGSKRAGALTHQLLGFVREQIIVPVMLDLNETVGGMLDMLGRLIREDVHLNWRPGQKLRMLRVDAGQVEQVLTNLVLNARDAVDGIDRIGKVTIETANVDFDTAFCADHVGFIPGRYVMLAVSDNGCGMDKATLERVYEPFFTTKGLAKATGLGLSIVYGLVKQNGGFIDAVSEPNRFTTFKIYLPIHATETTAEVELPLLASPMKAMETVLMVDDQQAILVVGKMLLTNLGYTVLTATTPQEAILQAEENSGAIHILVTDVIMPDMNGRELYERLKGSRPELKCIYMSGHSAGVIARERVLDGGSHFIEKPFTGGELAAKLRQALSQA